MSTKLPKFNVVPFTANTRALKLLDRATSDGKISAQEAKAIVQASNRSATELRVIKGLVDNARVQLAINGERGPVVDTSYPARVAFAKFALQQQGSAIEWC